MYYLNFIHLSFIFHPFIEGLAEIFCIAAAICILTLAWASQSFFRKWEQTGKLVLDQKKYREAIDALETLKTQFKNIIERNADGIIIVNADGIIDFLNPAAEILLGRKKDELIGQLFGSPVVRGETIELNLIRRDSEVIVVEMRVTDTEWEGETAFLASLRDVTERNMAEAKLKEANELLRQALQKIEEKQQQVIKQECLNALGKMASGIAHDFNNSLTPILGFSEIMIERPENLENKDKVLHYFRVINTAAKDAAKAVTRMREFYRPHEKSETSKFVDLNQIILQAISLTQPKWKDQALAAGKQITIVTDLSTQPTFVPGSEIGLREVFINLIFNAIDAIYKDGTLTLCTRSEDEYIVVEVKDTGIGMPPLSIQYCFEPLFTTKGPREGSGLGLAMVYGTIRRHQGTVDIKSEPGKGTNFTIRLPLKIKGTVI